MLSIRYTIIITFIKNKILPNIMNTETLISLGLSKREAEAYYTLLQVNDALASEISEKTNESRTNTYDKKTP